MIYVAAAILAIANVLSLNAPASDEKALAARLKRHMLTTAIKQASCCGENGRPKVADFDIVTYDWSYKGAKMDILPLDFQEALCQHAARTPPPPSAGRHSISESRRI